MPAAGKSHSAVNEIYFQRLVFLYYYLYFLKAAYDSCAVKQPVNKIALSIKILLLCFKIPDSHQFSEKILIFFKVMKITIIHFFVTL
jgi:hypothetical protein